MDRDVDLPLLRTLLSVVEAGSLTEASRRMFRTQPAISQRIQRLEEIVGVSVLRRNIVGVALTSEGEIVHGYAKAIVSLHDKLIDSMRCDVIEQVRIGIAEECGVASWTGAFEQIRQQFPRTRLLVDFRFDGDIEKRFQAGQYDVAVRASVSPTQHHEATTFRSPLLWVSAAGAPVDSGPEIRLALLPPGSAFRTEIVSVLSETALRWSVVCESNCAQSLHQALEAGWGISAIPRCALAPGRLTHVEYEGLPSLPTVYISVVRNPFCGCMAAGDVASVLEQFLQGNDPDWGGSYPESADR